MTAAPSPAHPREGGDLLARTRQIADATIFHPGFGDPTPVAGGFGGLVAWVKAQAGGPGAAPLQLVPARACYPGLDPFWAVTVRRGGGVRGHRRRPLDGRRGPRLRAGRHAEGRDVTWSTGFALLCACAAGVAASNAHPVIAAFDAACAAALAWGARDRTDPEPRP